MKPPAAPGPLTLVFFGTAPLACPSLRALHQAPHTRVAAVVTQPDRPQGRHLRLQPSAVKQAARELDLSLYQPERARSPAFLEELRALAPDLAVVAAYGQLLPQALLDIPRHGCVNVHASLLPRYRGAAPIQRAILAGEPETGVTLMKIDAGLDTGDILAQRATPITESDTSETLHDRLAELGAELLLVTLPAYVQGTLSPRPQDHDQATYAHKITREDGWLDWAHPATALGNRVRALHPWPGAHTTFPVGSERARLKVWTAQVVPGAAGEPGEVLQADPAGLVIACGQGGLQLVTVQREGGRRLGAAEFLAGQRLRPGQRLGQT